MKKVTKWALQDFFFKYNNKCTLGVGIFLFIYLFCLNRDNWWQVMVIHPSGPKEEEFHPTRSHSKQTHQLGTSNSGPPTFFLFIGELQSAPLLLDHLLWFIRCWIWTKPRNKTSIWYQSCHLLESNLRSVTYKWRARFGPSHITRQSFGIELAIYGYWT